MADRKWFVEQWKSGGCAVCGAEKRDPRTSMAHHSCYDSLGELDKQDMAAATLDTKFGPARAIAPSRVVTVVDTATPLLSRALSVLADVNTRYMDTPTRLRVDQLRRDIANHICPPNAADKKGAR
jgi:hypothetical protein